MEPKSHPVHAYVVCGLSTMMPSCSRDRQSWFEHGPSLSSNRKHNQTIIKVNGGQELCMTDFQGQRASFATDVLPTWFLNFTAGKGQFDRLIYNQFVQVDGSSLDLLRSNSIGDAWPGYSRGFASCLQQSSRIYCTLSSKRPALSKKNKRPKFPFASFRDSTIPPSEDELTLIVAGGVLGALAGFVQMSLGYLGCDELCCYAGVELCCSDVLRDTPFTLKNSCGTLAGGGALAPKALWPRRCVLVPAQAMDERESQSEVFGLFS